MAEQLQTDKPRLDQLQSKGSQSQGSQSQGNPSHGNGLGGETQGLDSIAGIQGQVSPDTGLQRAADTSYTNVVPAEGVSPDTGVAVPTTEDIQNDAANAVMGGSSEVVQKPGDAPFKLDDQPQDRAERRDDPLSQEGTYEGKKVFRPNELNQAGEDKEYFPPKEQHRFHVPEDVQHHALRPDLTLKPGATKPEIEVKTKA